jgi:hypothetical protein
VHRRPVRGVRPGRAAGPEAEEAIVTGTPLTRVPARDAERSGPLSAAYSDAETAFATG